MLIYFGVAASVTLLGYLSTRLGRQRDTTTDVRALDGAAGEPRLGRRLLRWLLTWQREPWPRWNVFDVAATAILVVFSAVRYDVGTDYDIYALNVAKIDLEDWGGHFARSALDPGYTLLAIGLRAVTDLPFAIFAVAAVLTVVPIMVALKRLSADLGPALGLYVMLGTYVAAFNGVRQGIAIGLNLLAVRYIRTKPALFVGLSVLASLFHLSAAFAAVVQLATLRWRPGVRSAGIVLGAAVAITIALSLPPVAGGLTVIVPRYAEYFEASATGVGSYLVIVAKLALVVFAFYVLRWRARDPYLGWVVVGLAFLIIGTQFQYISRMEGYFGIFFALLLPNALSAAQLGSRFKRALAAALLVAAGIYFGFYVAFYNDVLPYQTYLWSDAPFPIPSTPPR